MKVYFPDTNFFFECRKASELPWHELDGTKSSQNADIRLIVPPTVITEIERHKAKGNSRTTRRARDASASFRKALGSNERTELRSANPRVLLELPPIIRVDFSQFPNLDPDRPDHRMAAEYAIIRQCGALDCFAFGSQ
jgi:PIN domain